MHAKSEPRKTLSKRTIDAIKPTDKEQIVFDAHLPGFGIRVYPTGRRTFFVQYRNGGRTRRVKLGLYGAITADEARNLARQRLGEVAKGENPAEEIHKHRRAPTVAQACSRFIEEHIELRLKPTTQREYKRSIEKFINPRIGTRKIADITRPEIAELHHELRHIPFQANRTLGVLSKLFNLCEIWGLRPDGSNPCRHIMKYPENRRERFLSNEETQRLHEVLDHLERQRPEMAYSCYAIRLLMLTGCRLREIQTLKWEYIQEPYIRLPDTKTGARKIPLSPHVRQVLQNIPRIEGNPYVIVGKVDGQHLTDMQRPWRRIRAAAGLDDVRIHDLRHTYASVAIASGLDIVMVGKLLGHTQIQTTMRYTHLADDPVKEAASLVASQIGERVGEVQQDYTIKSQGKKSNVVQFPRNS